MVSQPNFGDARAAPAATVPDDGRRRTCGVVMVDLDMTRECASAGTPTTSRTVLSAVSAGCADSRGDWMAGVAAAARFATEANDAGVMRHRGDDRQAATGSPLEPRASELMRERTTQGPVAMWSDGNDACYAAVPIDEGDGGFIWMRRATPFQRQEVLALRQVAVVAVLLSALDRRCARAELMAEELQHRSANDLQLVSSLLGFHARRAAANDATRILTTVAESITALAMARRHAEGDLATALREFCDALAAQAEPRGIVVTLTMEGDVRQLPRSIAGLTLIAINEIVTNAMKHAFADRAHGTIRIAVAAGDGRLHASVDDDGLPFPEPTACPRLGSGLDLVGRLLAGAQGTLKPPRPGDKRFAIELPLRVRA